MIALFLDIIFLSCYFQDFSHLSKVFVLGFSNPFLMVIYQKKDTNLVRCLTGHATGGGHLGVTVFATGGAGGDTKNFFEKLIVFGVLENAKNYRLFEKIFRVPPPPLRTQ